MNLPVKLPEKVKGYRSRVINGIIDYLQALTPINTPTIRHEARVDGVASVAMGMGYLPDDRLHFKVEKVGATSVRVHGGAWTRGVLNPSLALSTITRYLTTDAGTSAFYAGIKTFSPTTNYPYINLLLDSATAPTTVTVESTNSFPGSADVRKPIAYLTWADNKIVDIEQLWTGGDITDHWHTAH